MICRIHDNPNGVPSVPYVAVCVAVCVAMWVAVGCSELQNP